MNLNLNFNVAELNHKNLVCMICLDELNDPIQPCHECKKSFCRQCISDLKRLGLGNYKDKCPACRTNLSDTDVLFKEACFVFVRWVRHGRNKRDPLLKQLVSLYNQCIEIDTQHCAAHVCLAGMYLSGYGVEQNYKEAVRLYRHATQQGDAIAQFYLGGMYHKGKGVTQDYSQTIHFYSLAAKQGVPQAQYNLGIMYYHGMGVTTNKNKAKYFFTLAANQQYKKAQDKLTLINDNVNKQTYEVKTKNTWLGQSWTPFGFDFLIDLFV
jgi:TPR repeat protein